MNTVLQKYEHELKVLHAQIGAHIITGEILGDDMSDAQLDKWERDNDRAQFLLDVLVGVKSAMETEKELTAKTTRELMHMVAEHLSGKSVNLLVEQPSENWRAGETWHDGNGINILLNPDNMWDANRTLKTFLHEVAHAKEHFTRYGLVSEEWGGQYETEARGQAAKWLQYADFHASEYHHTGAINQSADYMRARLLALLDLRA